MKKRIILIVILFLLNCANEKNPFNPTNEKGFFQEQLLPYIGKKNYSVTFMIFLNGANNLEEASVLDFYYEIASANLLSPDKEINVLVLYDRIAGYEDFDNWTGTRLYKITKFGVERVGGVTINGVKLSVTGDNDELNMGDPKTLQDFVKYSITGYPADIYILDIWNHGDGWRWANNLNLTKITKGVSIDEESGDDYLKVYEIRQALENVGRKIDIIYFDACLMQMVEVAYELRNCASYIVASEDLVPGYGANYIDVFDRIRKLKSISDFNFALELFNSYKWQYYFSEETCFSIVETEGIENLINALNDFATNLTNKPFSLISNARVNTSSLAYTNGGHYYYADLYSFADNIKSYVPSANNVIDVINSVVKASYYNSGNAVYGLSIYFPDAPSLVESEYTNKDYGLEFLKDCKWREFIKWYGKH